MEHPSFFDQLWQKVASQASGLPADLPLLSRLQRLLYIYRQGLTELNAFLEHYHFSSAEEEILFFKAQKPLLYSQVIYYLKRYHIALRQPPFPASEQLRYFQHELDRSQEFLQAHAAHYDYFRSDATHLDEQYFLRGSVSPQPPLTAAQFNLHTRVATPMDFLFSQFRAIEQLQAWLLEQVDTTRLADPDSPGLHWTASKVALVELVYALQATGVFNEGQATVKDIVARFEQLFQVDLGNYYGSFNEMRLRKKERIPLLTEMQKKVLERMDTLDGG